MYPYSIYAWHEKVSEEEVWVQHQETHDRRQSQRQDRSQRQDQSQSPGHAQDKGWSETPESGEEDAGQKQTQTHSRTERGDARQESEKKRQR